VNFTFTVEVDRRGEWEQIFEESWRSMKYRFYDEDMHGMDWAAIRPSTSRCSATPARTRTSTTWRTT
jgi:hypothetical protein